MTNYRTILADLPWKESGGGRIKRGADRHYPLLPTKKIPGVMKDSPNWCPADDSHLYLWVTNTFLPDGLWVMEELGYRYVTNIAWIKDRTGLGQYFRGQHELLLFGVRGTGYNVRTDRRDLSGVLDEGGFVEAPRGKHSAKPTTFHELIEARSKGPYLEMFAREPREGWDIWGTDVAEN